MKLNALGHADAELAKLHVIISARLGKNIGEDTQNSDNYVLCFVS